MTSGRHCYNYLGRDINFNLNYINSLSPHDELKHHFTSLKTGFYNENFNKNGLPILGQYLAIFFNFSPTLNHLHPLQVENCNSNSRLVVDEDDNGKCRLQRVK